MNNPGIDLEIWRQLKNRWIELDGGGHKIKVDFKLIAHPADKRNIMAIDVIQTIDGQFVTETVQRSIGEAYGSLGLAGLAMERLMEVYKGIMKELYSQTNSTDSELVATMSLTSSTSGEIKGIISRINSPEENSIIVNYKHYYVLTALREKMIESTGDGWNRVRAVYRPDEMEFYFEY